MKIKRGTTREVLLIGRIAIKVASFRSYKLFLSGILGNMQEKFWWSSLVLHRDKMCPVLFVGPLKIIIVMRRADSANLSRDEAIVLSKEFLELGIPVEGKPCSFGKINGKIIAVDYG